MFHAENSTMFKTIEENVRERLYILFIIYINDESIPSIKVHIYFIDFFFIILYTQLL